jgi:hypothetical protein
MMCRECRHPDVAWSPTASYIATASDDKTLRLWSAETGDAFVEFRGHTNFVFSCRFNPQSNLLVSGVSALARERQWGMASLLFTIIRFPREFSLDFPTLFLLPGVIHSIAAAVVRRDRQAVGREMRRVRRHASGAFQPRHRCGFQSRWNVHRQVS